MADVQPSHAEVVGDAVVKNTIVSWVARLSGFVSALIIFRTLDPAQYGQWRLVLAAWGLVQGWLSSAVSVVITETIRSRSGTGGEFDGKAAFAGYIKLMAAVSIALSFICMLIPESVGRVIGVRDPVLIQIVAIYFLLSVPRSAASLWIPISYRYGAQILITVSETILYAGGLLLFLPVMHLGARGIAWAQIASTCAGVLLAWRILPDLWRSVPLRSTRRQIRELLLIIRKHGKWAVAGDAMKDLLDAGRYRLLAHVVGSEAVGLFGLAESLLGHVAGMVSTGGPLTAALPRIVGDPPRLSAAMGKASRVGTGLSLGMFVFAFAVVPFAVPWLFPKYLPAIGLFLIVSFILPFVGFGAVLNAVFPALRLQRPLFVALAIRSFASIVFLWFALPAFGVKGLAYEYVGGSLLFYTMRWLYLRRRFEPKLRLRDFFHLRWSDLQEITTIMRHRIQRLMKPEK